MSTVGSIIKCYTALGKHLSVGPLVTLIKEPPGQWIGTGVCGSLWIPMNRHWCSENLWTPVDTNGCALLLMEAYGY